MAKKPVKIIDAEVVSTKKISKNSPIKISAILILILLGIIAGTGFVIGRVTAPVTIKKIVVDKKGNEWFTINQFVEDSDTPDEFKDADFITGFIDLKNLKEHTRGFINVTHFSYGCTGEIFNSPGFTWCTKDWVVKLTEAIPDSVMEKYYRRK